MIVTTTPNIEGKKIIQYLGLVAGEAVMGANMFKDMFASLRDIVGGRSASYEKELRKARDMALQELEDSANDLGANAVVGVDIDYEVLGEKNGMLMVSVNCCQSWMIPIRPTNNYLKEGSRYAVQVRNLQRQKGGVQIPIQGPKW
jgi:uncharacterized protein YbjQ (UPF0145 family)